MKKPKKNILEKKFLFAHARTLEASETDGPEAIYSDGLISLKPDNDQKLDRKEMKKWKAY